MDMCGGVLTEPAAPGSHAGILFMDNGGYGSISAHGVIAATVIALGRGILMPGGDGTSIVLDTPAGSIRARAGENGTVSFSNVPSFVLYAGVPVKACGRTFRADVAFAGAFYAIVDGEAAGIAIDGHHLPELRRAGLEIKRVIEDGPSIVHPLEPRVSGIEGTIFTGPSLDGHADLRGLTIFANGAADRSPGAGIAAVATVLHTMGLLADSTPFVQESISGAHFTCRVAAHTALGDHEGIVIDIEGSAWITGEHTFLVDDGDPFGAGLAL
jgi:proline racemase